MTINILKDSFGDSVVSCNICLYWYYVFFFLLSNSVNLPI